MSFNQYFHKTYSSQQFNQLFFHRRQPHRDKSPQLPGVFSRSVGHARPNAEHRRALPQVHGPAGRPEAVQQEHDESHRGHSPAAGAQGAADRALRRRRG